MESIQSNIRAEIKRGAFTAPVGSEAFRGYAIACSMGLDPEMESAAHLILGYPMSFEFLGETLQSFSGRALCDLIRFRRHCMDNLVSRLNTFFDVRSRSQIFRSKSVELKGGFTHAISSPSTILEEYLIALKNHT